MLARFTATPQNIQVSLMVKLRREVGPFQLKHLFFAFPLFLSSNNMLLCVPVLTLHIMEKDKQLLSQNYKEPSFPPSTLILAFYTPEKSLGTPPQHTNEVSCLNM